VNVRPQRSVHLSGDNTHTRTSRSRAVNRDALGVLALAALAILAIAVGAAAIDAPTQTAGTGGGSDGGSGGLFGEGSAFSLAQSSQNPPTLGGGLPKIGFQVLIAALIMSFLIALYLQRDEIGLRDLRNVAVVVAALGLLSIVFYYVIRSFSGSSNTMSGNRTMGRATPAAPGGGAGGTADTALQPVATNLPLVALVVGAVLLVGLAVVFRSDNEDTPSESESEPDETTRMTEVGRAAGRAADRIADDTSVDNEVYRAWREMTEQVGVGDPHSRTPDEFARAATDAGMAREDVAELTDLFRAVRYGGTSATDEREARAVAALRRIEDEYAEEP
jgi:hypothetical protein